MANITFKSGTIIDSPVTHDKYRIGGFLGEGGFGSAYRAARLDAKGRAIDELCLKVTLDPGGWHREAYFGEMLRSCDRAIRMHEAFPLPPARKGRPVRYCLVFELAAGTIWHHLEETGRPWSAQRATREIVALLKLLDRLHQTGALHRDITPMNVFMGRNGSLKLGDFGIARHVLFGKQPATVFNPWFVSNKMAEGERKHWLAADDVFQMGQLLAMLLRGEPHSIEQKNVRDIACDEELQRIIARAIGPRKSRYENAYEMLRALEGNPESSQPDFDILEGKRVVFTGPLSLHRFDAEVLVRQAGGTVAGKVTEQVNVVVQGGRSPHYGNGHKGVKLRQAENLIRQGHSITILSECEFRKLVKA